MALPFTRNRGDQPGKWPQGRQVWKGGVLPIKMHWGFMGFVLPLSPTPLIHLSLEWNLPVSFFSLIYLWFIDRVWLNQSYRHKQMFKLPNVYSSKHNLNILLNHGQSEAFEIWSSFGKRIKRETGFIVHYQPKVTKVHWLLLADAFRLQNVIFKLVASPEACRKCPTSEGLSPFESESVFEGNFQDVKQWVSKWIWQLRNWLDSMLGMGTDLGELAMCTRIL